MQVDRAQFLMLTTAIASGGCVAGQAPAAPAEPAAVVGAPVAAKQTPLDAATPAVPTLEPEQVAEPSVLREEDENDDPQMRVLLSAPTTCPNQVVRVGSCSLLRAPGPHCESFATTAGACYSFAASLQPRVAEKAVSCLLSHSGKRDICQYDVASKCAVQALRSACIEPFTEPYCRALVQACASMRGHPLSLSTCQQALSAVAAGNRSNMITCITESCSVDSCFFD